MMLRMKLKCLATAVMVLTVSCANAEIKGAGSTFAANLYRTWSQAHKIGDSRLEYDAVGSGAGIKAAQDHSVDFGASDRPLPRATLDQAGLVQFPTAIGGVVLVTNVPGVPSDKLKLDAEVLAGIYLGKITQWNDPKIKALNPELAVPSLPIVPIFRAENSGTSFALTSYLSKVSPQFKSAFGATSQLTPAGGRAGKTSAEIAKIVHDTAGSIGYFDYSFAADLGLPTVQMKNQWGKFVSAGRESLQLSMRAADWEKLLIDQNPTFEMDLTDAGCPGCWPIATATYVVVPLKGRNGSSVRVLEFFDHSLQHGDEIAAKEGYVPLPTRAKNIVALSMRRWQLSLDKTGSARPLRQ